MKTVVGLFDEIEDARNALEAFVNRGFSRDDISLVARRSENVPVGEVEATHADETAEGAAVGAFGGGLVGGLAGLVVGLGALAVPGIGPIIAAGPIVAALTGAGIGAATGGILGALVGWGLPAEEAEYYAEGIRRGGTLVAVKVDESRVNEAFEIMENHSAVDIERRSAMWRDSGSDNYGNYDGDTYNQNDYELAQKRHEDYGTSYYAYAPAFRRHYDLNYATNGYTFEQLEPGYRYGYRLANDDNYADYNDWDDMESAARSGWEDTEDAVNHTWEDIKGAVRHAWEQITEPFDNDAGHTHR